MLTLAVPLSLLKPTEISLGIRPRQSKVIDCKEVMKVTFVSSGSVCVVTLPPPEKSIVTLYVEVVSICTVVCP